MTLSYMLLSIYFGIWHDDLVTDDGLYGYYITCLVTSDSYALFYVCDLCIFGSDSDFSDMYCGCREDGFTLVCYDSMYSGLLATLAMECCLLRTCVSWPVPLT